MADKAPDLKGEQSQSDPSADTSRAEYGALRSEIDRRAGTQWNVFALQVASAKAIGSFALSSQNVELLLLIPLSSYMLGCRYILHDYYIKPIHRYIETRISPRLNDDLHWEGWKKAATERETDPRNWLTVTGWNFTHPTRLAFVGVAMLALIGALGEGIYLWAKNEPGWWVVTGYILLWCLGLIMTALLNWFFYKGDRLKLPENLGQ
jgi:hypothetical protein